MQKLGEYKMTTKLTHMINTPDEALDEIIAFVKRHATSHEDASDLFDEEYDIQALAKQYDNKRSKEEIKAFVNYYGQIDYCKTAENGIWGALEIAFKDNADDIGDFDQNEYNVTARFYDPHQVAACITHARLTAAWNTLVNTIWMDDVIDEEDFDFNSKIANAILKEIKKLRNMPQWFETEDDLD